MSDDEGISGFPYLRRRGPLALIGVSSAVPTAPLMATGKLGRAQLDALDPMLAQLASEQAFRVLLVHHPLHSNSRMKQLTDSRQLRALLKRHGVEHDGANPERHAADQPPIKMKQPPHLRLVLLSQVLQDRHGHLG